MEKVSVSRYTKFYLRNSLTGELFECSEDEFNKVVVKYRRILKFKCDNSDVQYFVINDVIEAKRCGLITEEYMRN